MNLGKDKAQREPHPIPELHYTSCIALTSKKASFASETVLVTKRSAFVGMQFHGVQKS